MKESKTSTNRKSREELAEAHRLYMTQCKNWAAWKKSKAKILKLHPERRKP